MASRVGQFMHYVYLIRSESNSSETYVGLTNDFKKRLVSHNEGANKHTAKFKPWTLECYIAFTSRAKAAKFERYLKHGSGHAFAKRHLWNNS
jgi:predicted GIY-YIG superfamily endonuclease